jgi:hypothetical protein
VRPLAALPARAKGTRLGPSRKREGRPANKRGKPQPQRAHGWGPRASARGSPRYRGGNRQTERKRASATGKTGEGGRGHGWGPRASARGNLQTKGGNRSHSGSTAGALARARGETCKQKGETAATAGARLGPLRKRKGKPANKRVEFGGASSDLQRGFRRGGALFGRGSLAWIETQAHSAPT